MNKKLIFNDLKKNRLITIATIVFMAISAMMIGLTILLFGSLLGSIDRLMIAAKTPTFLQMHSGEVNMEELESFALSTSAVENMQIVGFLNLENGRIYLGDHSLAESTQDNGLCVQNEHFDYLLDMDGNIIEADPGQVYVPVCYRNEYKVKEGDIFSFGEYEMTVAGFLRDSQMNSMMASSKRFLVNEEDYRNLSMQGDEEYLIEFRLKIGADVNEFASEYTNAGLPSNGPTITYSLIKLMNALSDGMMIFVILLVSVVILIISILCIRNILLTSLEKDKREIGTMKAIGISQKDINEVYFSKFILLSLVGAVLGALGAIIVSFPMSSQMKALYGMSDKMAPVYMMSVAGIVLVEGIILLSVNRILKRMRKLSVTDALYGEGRRENRKRRYLFISIIVAAAVALMVIPKNMASTLNSPKFVTYMGIGDSELRIDIRQSDNINVVTKEVTDMLGKDSRVEGYAAMSTSTLDATLPDGSLGKLMVENGDHGRYPVSYIEGTYPQKTDEIALSKLNADELNVKLNDELIIDGISCRVCGIYSDITNGGKTAKGCMNENDTSVMWSIIYLNLCEGEDVKEWSEEYQTALSKLQKGIKVTDISGYVKATYGQTISNINKASILSEIAAVIVLFVVALLFMRLIVWQTRNECSLKKALGFTNTDVRKEYLWTALKYTSLGVVAGILIGVFPGEKLAGMILGSLGASGFTFIINPVSVFFASPLLAIAAAMAAIRVSLSEIGRISAYECCINRE